MEKLQIPLVEQNTYIFIDASNIRASCIKTLGFLIDFDKLLTYFQHKYPNLKDARYYEGIAKGDEKKQRVFRFLKRKGYTICPLERKSYHLTEVEKREIECPKCGNTWAVEFARENRTMKSNVDVYLATELLRVAHFATEPTHIILVSCDGDYAETIKDALQNENVSVSVLATPPAKDFAKNTLSIRLQVLRSGAMPRYQLTNIASIADLIAAQPKNDIKNEDGSEDTSPRVRHAAPVSLS